jgi:UDP-N-acetylglucosamine 2-epimerase (non-hydrolysing)
MPRPLVCLVAGARPNFVKVAPLFRALVNSDGFRVRLVHTGQHYDDEMSGSFFRDLGIDPPAAQLEVGSGSHAVQTARIMQAFEAELVAYEPDVVMVVGDVNSTLACALVATKVSYPDGRRPRVAHVEAGLRSFDRSMPEEINRVVVDAVADCLFVTEPSAIDNLRREGCGDEQIFFVGNVMIDTLRAQAGEARRRQAWRRFDVDERGFGVVTLHRPSNVDDGSRLRRLWLALEAAAARLPLIFAVHPRTRQQLDRLGLGDSRRLTLSPPLPYGDFLSLLTGARLVLTDSGGIQEEATILGVPCLTLRDTTERPITVTHGTNRLIGIDAAAIAPHVDAVLAAPMPSPRTPPLWDGAAAQRIVAVLERLVQMRATRSESTAAV